MNLDLKAPSSLRWVWSEHWKLAFVPHTPLRLVVRCCVKFWISFQAQRSRLASTDRTAKSWPTAVRRSWRRRRSRWPIVWLAPAASPRRKQSWSNSRVGKNFKSGFLCSRGFFPKSSGLCYKHMTIANCTSNVVNKLEDLLADDARVIIYDRHVFIVQATGLSSQNF